MNEDKSTRYHRQRRWAESLVLGVHAAPLVACLGLGLAPWVIGRSSATVRLFGLPDTVLMTTAGFAVLLVVAGDAFALPAAWYSRFWLERRYRASRLTGASWLVSYLVEMLVHATLMALLTLGVYVAIGSWSDGWWLVTGGVFVVLTLVLTHVGPVVVLPAVSRVKPLTKPLLRNRLEALARRVGVPVLGLYEWTPGLGQPHPNAMLVGLGSTRRVLLTDSLLADFSDHEIEVVVAHEFAHYLHRDLWTTLVSEALFAVFVGAAAHLVVAELGPAFGIGSIADPVGLPALALVAGAATALLAPVRNLISRWQERRADRDAVKMTGNAPALVSGVRRLAAQSLAEERPPRVARWLLSTHPPFTDRVTAALSLARAERR